MLRFLLGLILAAAIPVVFGQEGRVIAGVPLATNVSSHARIDLDVRAIQQALDALDFNTARNIFQNGANSRRGSGSLRTIASFSRAGLSLNDKTYAMYQSFFGGDATYANTYINSALDGTGDFAGVALETRAGAVSLAVNVLSIWSYTINEIEDGWVDCKNGDPLANVDEVLSVDEGWAFYTGSLEGQQVGGSLPPAAPGVGLYRFAKDMAIAFGTSDPMRINNRMSRVNAEIAGNLSELVISSQQEAPQCNRTRQLVDNIINTMKVPLVQGLIHSIYSLAATTGDSVAQRQLRGRAWTMRQAVAPLISRCAPSVIDDLTTTLNPRTGTVPNLAAARRISDGLELTYLCMQISCRDVGAATALGHTQCNDRSLAGYSFRTQVMDRAFIDLDIRRIQQLVAGNTLDATRWSAARAIYEAGLSSVRADGRIRNLASLSRDDAKFAGEEIFEKYKRAYGSGRYADNWIVAAFDGTAPFNTNMPVTMRREGLVKGIQYMTLWNYVIHELEDGLGDCRLGETRDNSADNDFVGSIDEAWAFYTGSSLWASGRLSANETLTLYTAADKRCAEFGTCEGQDQRSAVNNKVLAAMVSTQAAAEVKNCARMATEIAIIKAQMRVPIIQGVLKYLYLMDPKAWGLTEAPRKEWAEGATFFRAIQPLVAECDANVATKILNNIDLSLNPTQVLKDGYKSLITALQSVYPCLKITCADVGYYNGIQDPICRDPVVPFALTLSGYSFLTDVQDRMRVDLDLRDIIEALNTESWSAARAIYDNGKYSVRASGSVRSFRDLSVNFNRFRNESLWNIYSKYYNSTTYAHDLIMRAFEGQGDFANRLPVMRREVIQKTILYQTMFNYVLHEMEEALGTCRVNERADRSADGDDALDVDEAWGFFVGSLHTIGSNGNLLYQANLKRCPEFKTCTNTANTRSRTNDRTLALFVSSQAAAPVHDCKLMEENMPRLRAQMTIPLIQGLLKYVYLADKTNPNKELATSNNQATLQKEWAEGFAFAAALLPLFDRCDPKVAQLVKDNFALGAERPMMSGTDAVTKAIQSTYQCLGVLCSEMGGFVNGQACKDTLSATNTSNGLSGGAIAGIVIASVIVYLVSLGLCYWRGRKSGQDAKNQAANGGIGGGAAAKPEWQYTPNGGSQRNGNGNGAAANGSKEQIEVV